MKIVKRLRSGCCRLSRPVRGGKQARGFALLVVVMIMLIVSFLASQLIMQVRTELRITANHKGRTASSFLSDAALKMALFRLVDTPLVLADEDLDQQIFLEGYPYQDRLPAGRFEYAVVSESGKIDLNTAPRGLLELFLASQQVEAEQIETIIDSLLDWRDPDDLHRLYGAEQETYEELPEPYMPRNGRIEEPEEFFLVYGTEELRGRFEPSDIFTIHNGGGKINFNSLAPAMLQFLANGDQARVEAYREAQSLYGKLDSALAREILGDERYEELQPYLSYNSGSNQYYTLVGTGWAGEDQDQGTEIQNQEQAGPTLPGVRIRTLIRREGPTRLQYLAWTERYV